MLCWILIDKTSLVLIRNCIENHKITFHVVSTTDFERKMAYFEKSKCEKCQNNNSDGKSWLGSKWFPKWAGKSAPSGCY